MMQEYQNAKFSSLASVIFMIVFAANLYAAPHSGMLSQPPLDSAEAERVRIWIPVEGAATCRVTVKVLDKDGSGKPVITLLDRIVPPGYHNIYWDKTDSLGRYVDSGNYPYTIESACGLTKNGKVRAEYKRWERSVEVLPAAETNPGGFGFKLLKDSAKVSIEVYSRGNMIINSPITDSLMMAGVHEFVWPKPLNYPSASYWCWLTVGDFKQRVDFKVK